MGVLYQLVQSRRMVDLTYQLLRRHFQDLEQAAAEAAVVYYQMREVLPRQAFTERFEDPVSISTLEAFFDRLELTREVAIHRWEQQHPAPEVRFAPRPAGSHVPADDPNLAYYTRDDASAGEWADYSDMEYRSRYEPAEVTMADDPDRDEFTHISPFGPDVQRLVPIPRLPAPIPGTPQASSSRAQLSPPRRESTPARVQQLARPELPLPRVSPSQRQATNAFRAPQLPAVPRTVRETPAAALAAEPEPSRPHPRPAYRTPDPRQRVVLLAQREPSSHSAYPAHTDAPLAPVPLTPRGNAPPR